MITLRNGRELMYASIEKITFWAKEQKLEIETETGLLIIRGKLGFLDFISLKARSNSGAIVNVRESPEPNMPAGAVSCAQVNWR